MTSIFDENSYLNADTCRVWVLRQVRAGLNAQQMQVQAETDFVIPENVSRIKEAISQMTEEGIVYDKHAGGNPQE